MPTKPTKYHTGDLVRVNFKYNWSIPQLVQLKQQRSIVLVLDGPRTEEGVVQYQIKLQDVIWVPRAALLRRANEKSGRHMPTQWATVSITIRRIVPRSWI